MGAVGRAIAVMAAALGMLGAAEATPAALPWGKAVSILAPCNRQQLFHSADGVGASVLADRPDRLWILEARDGRMRLRAHGTSLYLSSDGESLRLAPATQALALAANAAPGGGFALQDSGGRALTLVGGAARLASSSTTCGSHLAIDPFPVYAPYTTTRYVDAAARRGGDGSRARPFRTLQAALAVARPGVRFLVAPGRYAGGAKLTKAQSGRSNAWIVIESEVPHGARIEGAGAASALQIDADYVEVHGFEVTHTGEEACLGAEGNHVRFVENWVHDCGGGGIATSRGAFYHIEGNVVARTAYRNRWQMSGISIYQARGPACRTWCNVVRRNISFANDNRERTWQNEDPTDGNGIIIDDFANTQLNSRAGAYAGRTLVEHNLVFGNGGSGVRVLLSDHVTVRANTAYHNMQRRDRGTWRGDIMNVFGRDNEFTSNVAIADPRSHDHFAALFDSGETPAGDRVSQARWRDNLVAADPPAQRALMRVGSGPTPTTAVVADAYPTLARPGLALDADFRLSGVQGRNTPDLQSFGADPTLLPRSP